MTAEAIARHEASPRKRGSTDPRGLNGSTTAAPRRRSKWGSIALPSGRLPPNGVTLSRPSWIWCWDTVATVVTGTVADVAMLQSVAAAVDGAMVQDALGEPAAIPGGGQLERAGLSGASTGASPGPTASDVPASAGPSPSPALLGHVAPDLEAPLPHSVDGAALSSQSVAGTAVLQTDVTSQSLIASLKDLGKTPAEPRDRPGSRRDRQPAAAARRIPRERRECLRPGVGDRCKLDGEPHGDAEALERDDRGPQAHECGLRAGWRGLRVIGFLGSAWMPHD